MAFTYQHDLDWREHFVRYGFALRRGLVGSDYCARALARAREIVDHVDLPLDQWTSANTPTLHTPYYEGAGPREPALDAVYDEPGVCESIAALFGSDEAWDRQRNYYLFVKGYEAKARQALAPRGHIDFASPPAPPLYRGFAFQVALTDTEPFGGNLTVHPGSHLTIQKALIDGHDVASSPDLPQEAPWEFVAQAGDVLFTHHLLAHSGNACHGAKHLPRVTLFCEAFSHAWVQHIDDEVAKQGPWFRSLAQNGPCENDPLNERRLEELRRKYVRDLRVKAEKGEAVGNAYA